MATEYFLYDTNINTSTGYNIIPISQEQFDAEKHQLVGTSPDFIENQYAPWVPALPGAEDGYGEWRGTLQEYPCGWYRTTRRLLIPMGIFEDPNGYGRRAYIKIQMAHNVAFAPTPWAECIYEANFYVDSYYDEYAYEDKRYLTITFGTTFHRPEADPSDIVEVYTARPAEPPKPPGSFWMNYVKTFEYPTGD